MKLILAQGNPGSEFSGTRHNVGFALIDSYARVHDAEWVEKSKFHAYIAEYSDGDEKTLLVKPTTYYNETGLSARALVDFYKLDPATDVLVLHDELALAFGTIRIREQGSDAGNNGIKSLNTHLGPNYTRIRIGIQNDMTAQMGAHAFVLAKFTAEETEKLRSTIFPKLQELIDAFLDDTHTVTSHTL